MADQETSEIYQELLRRGVFQHDAEAAAIGHEIRRRGAVHDESQGGRLNTWGGPKDPLGDPADQPPPKATPAPVKAPPRPSALPPALRNVHPESGVAGLFGLDMFGTGPHQGAIAKLVKPLTSPIVGATSHFVGAVSALAHGDRAGAARHLAAGRKDSDALASVVEAPVRHPAALYPAPVRQGAVAVDQAVGLLPGGRKAAGQTLRAIPAQTAQEFKDNPIGAALQYLPAVPHAIGAAGRVGRVVKAAGADARAAKAARLAPPVKPLDVSPMAAPGVKSAPALAPPAVRSLDVSRVPGPPAFKSPSTPPKGKAAPALAETPAPTTGAPQKLQAVKTDPHEIDLREKDKEGPRLQRARDLLSEDPDSEYHAPVTTYRPASGGNKVTIDGHHRVIAGRETGQPVRALSIDEPLYRHLQSLGYDDAEISYGMLDNAGETDAADSLHYEFPGADVQGRGYEVSDIIASSPKPGGAKLSPNPDPVTDSPAPAPQTPAETPQAPAAAPPPAPAPVAVTAPPAAPVNGSKPNTTGNMAGSVNLDNLTTTPEATARLKQSGDSAQTVAPQGHAEIEKAADALALRPEHLTNLTPGEVPQGVHPAVFDTAVRKLNVAKQEQATAADAAYQADKSPENLDALTKANMEAHGVLQHAQARARTSGQALSAYNIQASAYEGALAKTQGKQQALARTAALTDPKAAPKVPPRAKSYGANNTVFTQAARDAALERIREASGRLNAGVPIDVIKDAAIVGGYHLEAGLRKFGDWAAEMKKDVPGLSDEDLQRVWAATRAEYADKAKGNLKQTGNLVFADALAPRLGRQGVSDFMEELADHPGDLLGKLIRGESLTADERQVVNGVYRSHLPARQAGKRAPSPQALDQLNGIVKQFADANRRANLAKARANRAAPLSGAGMSVAPASLEATLAGRLGRKNVPDFLARLTSDPATAGTEAKLRAGQPLTDAERRAVAAHLDDLKKPAQANSPSDVSKMLTGIVRDAKAGRLGYPDAKAAVREELLSVIDSHRVPMLTRDLANVADGDFKGLAEVYNRYYPARFLDRARQVQQANLLSGPKTLGTIALAHAMGAGLEEAAVRPVAAAVGRGKVQGLNASATKATVGALGRGTKEAGRMMVEGPTAMQLRGMDPGYRIDLQPGRHIHPEFTSNTRSAAFNRLANVLVRVPGRAHAALYHALGTALEERGVQEAAALKAREQGGDPAQYVGDEDVKAAGASYRAEQMYQNPNRAASAVNAASATAGPIGEAVINALMPFRNVPLNLAGRGLEYSGGPATVGTALARLKYLHKTGKDILNPRKALTADEREAIERNVSYQIARGIVGSGLVAGGYALSTRGAMNPPNGKDFENGSINAGRLKYDIGRLHPTAMPVEVGGELQRMRAHKPFDIAGPIEDNPYFNAAETVQNIKEGASGDTRKMAQGLGGIAGQAVPTALGQIAQATDPSGHVRKKKSMLDYLKNRVPGLREKLPVSPHWEQSNIRSTGPLSLLSPVNVHRRK